MAYKPKRPYRQSLRLKGYDYSQPGNYFVTICSWQQLPLFETPTLSEMLIETWRNLPNRYPTITVDSFVVMPNHIHGIVNIHASIMDTSNPTLGNIINAFKSLVTVNWIRFNKVNGITYFGHIWQGRYYDHIVRNKQELDQIRTYLLNNPAKSLIQRGIEIDDETWEEIINRQILGYS
jgi:REP element-mobilizing transposase RayT